MFWMRNKKIIFSYTHLSGGLKNYPTCKEQKCLFKVFTGGISNVLYGYYQDGKYQEDVVLFRIEGEGTELMIDRKQERENIQVHV